MNIVLVTVDCLRYDRCAVNGFSKDTTPFLESAASEGLVYDRAYATGPVTTESIPGILAGRLSKHTHYGPSSFQKAIPDGANTIADHLRNEGYSTCAVISNPRVDTHVNIDRGFSHFENLRLAGEPEDEDSERQQDMLSLRLDSNLGEKLNQIRGRLRSAEGLPLYQRIGFLTARYYQYLRSWPSVSGERVLEKFGKRLKETDGPVFAWTHLMDLHGPIHPETVNEGGLYSASTFEQFQSHVTRMADVHDPRIDARYDSAVRRIDALLENLVQQTREQLGEDTAFIITADHGDALYERGCYGHPHHYVHDELLHVPFMVLHPDEEVSGRISSPFSLGTLHELIADIAGIDRMEAPMQTDRGSYFSEWTSDEPIVADSLSELGHTFTAFRPDCKYIGHSTTLDVEESRRSEEGTYKLLEGTRETLIERTDRELQTLAQSELIDPENLESTDSSISEEVQDQLRQLGYAE